MTTRRTLLRVLLTATLMVAAAPSVEAKPSIVSGIEIPFAIVDPAGECNSTGQVRVYPDVTPGLVATEEISATVSAPVCPTLAWNVRVGIIDNSPGFAHFTTAGNGTGSASASQNVRYANPGTPAPTPVRGAARVSFHITWWASNGVRGCLTNWWVVASYADAYEVGPIVPCDDRIVLM